MHTVWRRCGCCCYCRVSWHRGTLVTLARRFRGYLVPLHFFISASFFYLGVVKAC